eukprot:741536-Pelagomonas_calceolata.AAC.2
MLAALPGANSRKKQCRYQVAISLHYHTHNFHIEVVKYKQKLKVPKQQQDPNIQRDKGCILADVALLREQHASKQAQESRAASTHLALCERPGQLGCPKTRDRIGGEEPVVQQGAGTQQLQGGGDKKR